MLVSNVVYAEDITEIDLGTPTYLTLSTKDEKFILSWKSPINIFTLTNVDYQVDYKVGRGEWASLNGELKPNYLAFSPNGRSTIEIDPIAEGFIKDKIDLDNFNYSFRIRYRHSYEVEGVKELIVGFFSSPVNLGLQPYYQNASSWAFTELDKAVEYNLIPDDIKNDMKKEITREEFSEVAVKLYELITQLTVNIEGQTFTDTTNSEVLKAASLGIVKGIGDGKFAPTNPVTRQEIAVMLKRTLEAIYPDMDFSYSNNLPPTPESNIASWAIEEVNFMRDNSILKGDDNGLINPIGHTTREQSVILALRTHDIFKK